MHVVEKGTFKLDIIHVSFDTLAVTELYRSKGRKLQDATCGILREAVEKAAGLLVRGEPCHEFCSFDAGYPYGGSSTIGELVGKSEVHTRRVMVDKKKTSVGVKVMTECEMTSTVLHAYLQTLADLKRHLALKNWRGMKESQWFSEKKRIEGEIADIEVVPLLLAFIPSSFVLLTDTGQLWYTTTRGRKIELGKCLLVGRPAFGKTVIKKAYDRAVELTNAINDDSLVAVDLSQMQERMSLVGLMGVTDAVDNWCRLTGYPERSMLLSKGTVDIIRRPLDWDFFKLYVQMGGVDQRSDAAVADAKREFKRVMRALQLPLVGRAPTDLTKPFHAVCRVVGVPEVVAEIASRGVALCALRDASQTFQVISKGAHSTADAEQIVSGLIGHYGNMFASGKIVKLGQDTFSVAGLSFQAKDEFLTYLDAIFEYGLIESSRDLRLLHEVCDSLNAVWQATTVGMLPSLNVQLRRLIFPRWSKELREFGLVGLSDIRDRWHVQTKEFE